MDAPNYVQACYTHTHTHPHKPAHGEANKHQPYRLHPRNLISLCSRGERNITQRRPPPRPVWKTTVRVQRCCLAPASAPCSCKCMPPPMMFQHNASMQHTFALESMLAAAAVHTLPSHTKPPRHLCTQLRKGLQRTRKHLCRGESEASLSPAYFDCSLDRND